MVVYLKFDYSLLLKKMSTIAEIRTQLIIIDSFQETGDKITVENAVIYLKKYSNDINHIRQINKIDPMDYEEVLNYFEWILFVGVLIVTGR